MGEGVLGDRVSLNRQTGGLPHVCAAPPVQRRASLSFCDFLVLLWPKTALLRAVRINLFKQASSQPQPRNAKRLRIACPTARFPNHQRSANHRAELQKVSARLEYELLSAYSP